MKNAEQIEKLKREKAEAFSKWQKLDEPAKAAWQKYQKAGQALDDAILYEKVRRKVLRDLINEAGQEK